jgi:hypothetical protein
MKTIRSVHIPDSNLGVNNVPVAVNTSPAAGAPSCRNSLSAATAIRLRPHDRSAAEPTVLLAQQYRIDWG